MHSRGEQNIVIDCMQYCRYYHNKLKLDYYDLCNRLTFVLVSAWKNSVNAVIGRVGILLSLCAIELLNCIKETLPRIVSVALNSNSSTTIISYYSPTDTRDEKGITTCYNKLSSLIRKYSYHQWRYNSSTKQRLK